MHIVTRSRTRVETHSFQLPTGEITIEQRTVVETWQELVPEVGEAVSPGLVAENELLRASTFKTRVDDFLDLDASGTLSAGDLVRSQGGWSAYSSSGPTPSKPSLYEAEARLSAAFYEGELEGWSDEALAGFRHAVDEARAAYLEALASRPGDQRAADARLTELDALGLACAKDPMAAQGFDPRLPSLTTPVGAPFGVPTATGPGAPDRFYPGRTSYPVDPRSLEYLLDDPRYAEAVAGLKRPLWENYAHVELVQGEDPADCAIRAYPTGPTGAYDESDWLRGGLAATGGLLDDGTGKVLPPLPTGALSEPLGERTDMAKTVDISKWSGWLTQEDIEQLQAMGVTHVVVGTQNEEVTRQQLALLVQNGFTVDAYLYVNWDTKEYGPIESQVRSAVESFKDFPVGTFWFELEEEAQADALGLGPRQLVAMTQQGLAVWDELREELGLRTEAGIYTSRGFWGLTPEGPTMGHMGGSTAFADLPLWYARWPGDGVSPDALGASQFRDGALPFGGWTDEEIVARQYTDTIYLPGTEMAFDADWMLLPDNQRDQTFPTGAR